MLFFNGLIDEVRIYDYARTEEEIRLDYNAGLAAHLGPSGKTCSEDPAGCMDFGLVGHWDMDEGGGSVLNDKSGNNNHGTLTNGPKWTKGKNGGALQFDGVDDVVNVTDNNSLDFGAEDFSIATWVKSTGITGIMNGIIEHGQGEISSGYYLRFSSATSVQFLINTGGSTYQDFTAYGFEQNRWYHIVAVKSGNVITIYKNGKIVGSSDKGYQDWDASPSNNFYIGRVHGHQFNGLIDEVRIYNRALTEAEVKYHYNHGGAVAQWDMDEGSGTKVYDSSGNNANADFPATADYQPRWSTP